MRILIGLAVAALAVVGLGACSDDGKDLRAPPPGATAPLRPTSTTAAASATSDTLTPGLLVLSSPDFQPGAPLTADATCAGSGRSPALAWSGLPQGTVEVAIVVTEPDDDLFTNWVVAGLDPAGTIEAGTVPPGAIVAQNGDGQAAYAPPCAPSGGAQLVEFTLYALTSPSGVTADMPAEQAVATLDGSPSTRAVVTATVEGE